MQEYDVIILGAGAAGLFCAAQIEHSDKKIGIIEHNDRVGRKIQISGGGKCNFTNISASSGQYLSQNKHFMKSALSQYTQNDFIDLIKHYNISFFEKTLGQLFCEKGSKEIIQMLLDLNNKNSVDIILKTSIKSVSKVNDQFIIETSKDQFKAQYVVVATGGLSLPPIGASGIGYEIAKSFGHELTDKKAGLVGVELGRDDLQWTKELAGVSCFCEVSIGKNKFRENILFTHKGLSGPAILQISSYWDEGKTIKINFIPDQNVEEVVGKSGKISKNLERFLSKNFAKAILAKLEIEDTTLDQISKKKLNRLHEFLINSSFYLTKTEGYRKAEVTVGGVHTKDLSSKTMESKIETGLYFIGEVVDVTGWLGGYNFQWAWSSAYVSAKDISSKLINE